jgi:bacterioferritin
LGRAGREIVKADVKEVISDLQKAYADEWLAHYQYWLAAQWIRGIDADTLRPILLKQSEDELNHAGKLARRIVQLGGKPLLHFEELLKRSGCGYIAPPDDPTDHRRLVEGVLKAEQCAIRFYSEMVDKYRTSDVVTHEVFEELLEDEVDDEEEWERILSKL